MPRWSALSFVTLLSSSAWLPAQQLQAPDFVIPDSQNLFVVDLAATRKLGVWDDLEASVLKVVFSRIENEMGFPLDALDLLQVSMVLAGGDSPSDTQQVVVWKGNRALTMDASLFGPSWEDDRIGDYAVQRRARRSGDELFVKVRPELIVWGAETQVQPVLERARKAGPLAPDVQSLLSGREGRVVSLVFDLGSEMMRQRFLAQVMGATLSDWPEDDLPTHMSVQVLVTGDEDDPHIEVRAVLRHLREGKGIAASLAAADALVQRLGADTRLRLIHPLLKKAKAKQDHTDVVLQADFGRSRDAVGNIAALLLPVIGRGAEVEAQAPKPAEQPAGGDGK